MKLFDNPNIASTKMQCDNCKAYNGCPYRESITNLMKEMSARISYGDLIYIKKLSFTCKGYMLSDK